MAKNIHLLHNPGAGDGQHTKEELINILENAGHYCTYASIKEEGWKDFPHGTEWIAVAGGDGTIKKVVHHLHEMTGKEKYPIGLIPLGTANNIACTLGISKIIPDLVKNWGKNFTAFNTGFIKYGDEKILFGEGIGFGLFPEHIKAMSKKKSGPNTPEERLENDKSVLLESARSYKPFPVELQIDGKIYKGDYLMVEVLNIRSIGPNMTLSPDSDPGDGLLEVILVAEKDRQKLIHYLSEKLNGKETRLQLDPIPVKRMAMLSKNNSLHVDDEIPDMGEHSFVSVAINRKPLQFLI